MPRELIRPCFPYMDTTKVTLPATLIRIVYKTRFGAVQGHAGS